MFNVVLFSIFGTIIYSKSFIEARNISDGSTREGSFCQNPILNYDQGLILIDKKEIYEEGSYVLFACTSGRLVPPNARLYCDEGNWSGVSPTCDSSICHLSDLNRFQIIKNGSDINSVFSEGQSVAVTCPAFSGTLLVICQSNGKWLAPSQCPLYSDIPSCMSPDIRNGRVDCMTLHCDDFYVGVRVEVECNTGYQLRGPYQLTCFGDSNSSPQWNGLPYCALIRKVDPYGDLTSQTSVTALGLTRFTVLIVATTSVLCGLLVLITAVLICRFTLWRTARGSSGLESGRRSLPGSRGRGSGLTGSHQFSDVVNSRPRLSVIDISAPLGPSDDREALINPPTYEEAMAQGTLSLGRANRLYNSAVDDDDVMGDLGDPACGGGVYSGVGPSSRFHCRGQTTGGGRHSNTSRHQGVGFEPGVVEVVRVSRSGRQRERRPQEMDSVSRHSTQTSGSHGAPISGSVETMAISDGTSVTLRTYESHGSNPSLGSTRPQTGSVGEPAGSHYPNHVTSNGQIYDPQRHPSLVSTGPVYNGSSTSGQKDPDKEPDSVSTRS